MSYQRMNWTKNELVLALANPISAESGPHAHSYKHAVSGELANHPLFQKARVEYLISDSQSKSSNAIFFEKDPSGSGWLKKPDGTNVYSNSTRKKNPLPSADASAHSCLDVDFVADAVKTAFNHPLMQAHLKLLDSNYDMSVFVNYLTTIGRGMIHKNNSGTIQTTHNDFDCLFIKCKPNPHNKDIPIFQTVVPHAVHKAGGVTI